MAYTYDRIQIGDSASFSKTISESDTYLFAGITGDFNPMHVDEIKASKTPFAGRIVHGCLVDSMVSTILGMKYPGEGTIFMEKNVKYLAPVRMGDTITVTATVADKQGKGTVLLDTIYKNQNNETVITGTVKVKAPR